MKAAMLLPVLILLFLPITTSAQTIQSEISVLSKGADVIVKGKVIEQKSEWTTRKSAIYTKVTIHVDEYIKGNSTRNTIDVIHPGGEIGSIGELYTHVPSFTDGENVLLFASKTTNNNDYHVYEGETGKITLYTDDHGELVTSQRKKYSSLKNEIRKSLSID
jgi:hypothetical protein